jgi:[calcium/calmodulin-dependent protein kinase] kinase
MSNSASTPVLSSNKPNPNPVQRPQPISTRIPSRQNVVGTPKGPPPANFDSDSDYGDDDDDDDYDLEGGDEETYDYLSMNTAAGMEEIKAKETPKAAPKPQMRVMTEADDSSADDDSDYDAVDDVGEDAAEVYDFLAFNTAAGMDEIAKQKETPDAAPSTSSHLPAIAKASPPSKPSAKQQTPLTPTAPSQPPPPTITNAGLASPDPHAVKDTDKIKRKKASLPTNMPAVMSSNAHGNFFTNRYIVNNYILLDVLGTGSYAEVRLGKEKSTEDQLYAIKIMNKDLLMKKSVGMASTFMDDVRREIAIMKKLRHDNVLRLYEVMDDAKVNKLYLVLEYCKNGDLMQMTKGDARTNSCTPLSDVQIWDVFRQILKGLKYLHTQGIVHGDIKPQNLLVSATGVIKIADFGISKMIQSTDGEKEKLLETAGTPAFMSPELCSGKPYDGNLADVYALGATMFMLRCGTPPFVANKLIVLYNKIQSDPVVFTTECDSGLQKIIHDMMEKDPEKRVSLDGVIRNPWFIRQPLVKGGAMSPARAQSMDNNWSDAVSGSAEKIKLSSEDMMQSVHLAQGHSEKDRSDREQGDTRRLEKLEEVNKNTMSETELEKRVKSFQKKASIRQRSFETLDNLIEKDGVEKARSGSGAAGDSDDDDDMFDFGDDDLDEPISKLNSTAFNSIMDTLASQTPTPSKKKAAPIPSGALKVGKVLDGLPNAQIGIRAAFYSEKGKRPNQEDTVTVIMDLSSLGDKLPRPYLYQKFAFFGVYDGHGGGTTSKMLQHTLHMKLALGSDFFTNLEAASGKACDEADKEICGELRNMEDDSGSTGVFVVIDGRKKEFVVGNVGDSRCVLSRGGTAIELSKDHRIAVEHERNRVIEHGCKVRDGRVNGVLAVTRSFGDCAHKFSGEGKNGLDAVPEVRTEKIVDRDEFIILATDGLWDVMGSQQVINFVRLGLARHHKVKTICKELVKEAIKVGSIDNVSVVVVMLNQTREEKGGGGEGGGGGGDVKK